MSACKECGGAVSSQSKSGVCRACYLKDPLGYNLKINPDFERNRIAALRAATMANPVWRDKIRAHCRKLASDPSIRAARSERAKRQRLHDLGFPGTQTKEAKDKSNRTRVARQMAWCPPHLLDDYKHLRRAYRMLAADAKAIILDQHEAELRRLRTKMGVTGPVEVREVRYFPDKLTTREPGTDIAAERQKAEKARIDALRQRRSLCSICGARSDIGCEHQVAA